MRKPFMTATVDMVDGNMLVLIDIDDNVILYFADRDMLIV